MGRRPALTEIFGFGCRLHGPTCRTPWGYDEQHTDQDHPYTLDQLAERTAGPHRYAYPDHDAYLAGWALWLALRRDCALTAGERRARDSIGMAPDARARIVALGAEWAVDVTELLALVEEM